jgi:hypothetical protein
MATQPLLAPVSEIDSPDENLISASETVIRERPPIGQKHTDTVRDILKKYQLVQSSSLVHTGAKGYLCSVIPISSLLSSPDTGSGLLNHFARLYRLSKGSFNFKIVFKYEGNELADVLTLVDLVAQYIPPLPQNGGPTTISALQDTIANTFLMDPAFLTDPTYNARTSAAACATTLGYNRLPLHFVNGVTRTAEFNVPYTSNYASQLLSVFPSSPTELALYDMGYIALQSPVLPAGCTLHYSIFMSIGDETRFGTLFNVPTLIPIKTSGGTYMQPDDYTPPSSSFYNLKRVF